jgi:hypothetical protein
MLLLSLLLFHSTLSAHDLTSSTVKCPSLLALVLGKERPVLYRMKLDLPPKQLIQDLIPVVPGRGVTDKIKSVARNKMVASYLLNGLEGRTLENRTVDKSSLSGILKENAKYSFVLSEDGLDFVQTSQTPAGFFMTKHNVLSQLEPVIFAGEFWIDKNETLHVSNSSGTYQPKKELLPKIQEIFRRNFDLKIKLEAHGEN